MHLDKEGNYNIIALSPRFIKSYGSAIFSLLSYNIILFCIHFLCTTKKSKPQNMHQVTCHYVIISRCYINYIPYRNEQFKDLAHNCHNHLNIYTEIWSKQTVWLSDQAPHCWAWSESQSICSQIKNLSKTDKICAKYWIIPAADKFFKMAANITQHTRGDPELTGLVLYFGYK